MEYRIEYDKIMEIVEEEVSREGAQAVSADGISLYDSIRMVSRDEGKRKRLMAEVLAAIKSQCNRFISNVSFDQNTEEPVSFVFELDLSTRRGAGKELSLLTMFRSLTVNLLLNKFFISKNLSELAAKYDAAALMDVQALAKLLYEKLPPIYPTIV